MNDHTVALFDIPRGVRHGSGVHRQRRSSSLRALICTWSNRRTKMAMQTARSPPALVKMFDMNSEGGSRVCINTWTEAGSRDYCGRQGRIHEPAVATAKSGGRTAGTSRELRDILCVWAFFCSQTETSRDNCFEVWIACGRMGSCMQGLVGRRGFIRLLRPFRYPVASDYSKEPLLLPDPRPKISPLSVIHAVTFQPKQDCKTHLEVRPVN